MTATRWDYRPGATLSLIRDEETLLTYAFSTASAPKPYIHPLRTSDGVLLTAYQPSDHVWHRGLWFSWKYINDVNYWEEQVSDVECESRLASEGRTESRGDEALSFVAGDARLRHELGYVDPDAKTVLVEQRTVTVAPPRGDGTYSIDLVHDFTVADQEVTLSATPITADMPWGGYAGLGVRAARSLQGFRVLSSEGLRGTEANGAPSRWIDLSGVADGAADLAAGIAILDHPANPRHPPPAYVYYDASQFGYINLGPIRNEPLSLPAGARTRLAYRLVVHDGWGDAQRLDAAFADFARTMPSADVTDTQQQELSR